LCAHSLLTIGEALRCNYGNQRRAKFIFLQCVVASLELPPIILSGIKSCDSQQGNSVSIAW